MNTTIGGRTYNDDWRRHILTLYVAIFALSVLAGTIIWRESDRDAGGAAPVAAVSSETVRSTPVEHLVYLVDSPEAADLVLAADSDSDGARALGPFGGTHTTEVIDVSTAAGELVYRALTDAQNQLPVFSDGQPLQIFDLRR